MKSVVLCGSTKFKPQIKKFAHELKQAGIVVFEPYLIENIDEWNMASNEFKRAVTLGLAYDQFQKIRIGDVVFIYNENGYIGTSVTLELGFAVACSKPIYALSPDTNELCRDILINEIITTPQELVKRLS